MSFFSYFTDPVLRAPTIGCMLMALGSALVGVVAFLRKRSLLGEALSHATYPGVILAVIVGGSFFPSSESKLAFSFLVGAFFSAFLGLRIIEGLEKRFRVSSDAALCFVLSLFFGVGLTLASRVQFTHAGEYKQIVAYLYGQAATMTDTYITIYGLLATLIVLAIAFFYKEIQIVNFDPDYAKSMGVPAKEMDTLIFFLIVLAIIIGIRSVGVVLMSAMLIAPAVSARQYTNKLSHMFLGAGFIGVLSGFLGNYLSVELTQILATKYPSHYISLPTGPMIVLVSTLICLFSLAFAPKRGLLVRLLRIFSFRFTCFQENILKTIWRFGEKTPHSLKQIAQQQSASPFYIRLVLWNLARQGWLESKGEGMFMLTLHGSQRAAHIVRLHRLWEVYLADYLGVGAERVHHNAEEMEHIITPELEKKLTELLKDPKKDPHHQPIPPAGEV